MNPHDYALCCVSRICVLVMWSLPGPPMGSLRGRDGTEYLEQATSFTHNRGHTCCLHSAVVQATPYASSDLRILEYVCLLFVIADLVNDQQSEWHAGARSHLPSS